MHPDTAALMRWILRARGQVTPSMLAWWRYPYPTGQREARRRLAQLAERGWMLRAGSDRYPIYLLTPEGQAMAQVAEITVQCPATRRPRPQARHDSALAAILERAVALGAIRQWRSAGEFALAPSEVAGRKEPDALLEYRTRSGTAWAAVEAEASPKGGTLKRGRSNWASTATETARRLSDPLEVVIDDDIGSRTVQARSTVYLALSRQLADGIARHLLDTQALWLIGDRWSLRIRQEPGWVDLELKDPPPHIADGVPLGVTITDEEI